METGDIIKKLRKNRNITQGELAIMLGVNMSSIQKYESGATRNLKLETIRELCHIFDVPPIVFVFPESYEMTFEEYVKEFGHSNYFFGEILNLNDVGRKKALEYINDLRNLPKYTK